MNKRLECGSCLFYTDGWTRSEIYYEACLAKPDLDRILKSVEAKDMEHCPYALNFHKARQETMKRWKEDLENGE